MNLELLVRKSDYYNNAAPLWVRNIWARKEALDHFIKYNRRRLAAEGAVVKIGRDYFVDTETFPSIAMQVIGVKADGPNRNDQITNGGCHMKT
jgi:hypothetical protein